MDTKIMIKSILSCRDGDQLKANNVITRNESRIDTIGVFGYCLFC